ARTLRRGAVVGMAKVAFIGADPRRDANDSAAWQRFVDSVVNIVRPMRSPRDFFQPLAVGAPEPLREIPFPPSRMIHFFDASNEKMVAKLPDTIAKADIVLGNLEDAVPVDRKEAAREGLVKVGKSVDLGETQLWTRVNSLESPWVLDDLTTLVTEIGDKLD